MRAFAVRRLAVLTAVLACAGAIFAAGAAVAERALTEAPSDTEFTMAAIIDPSQPLPADWRAEVAPGVTVNIADRSGELDFRWVFANCVDGAHRFTGGPTPTIDLADELASRPYVMHVEVHEIYPRQWQGNVRFTPLGTSDPTFTAQFISPRTCDVRG